MGLKENIRRILREDYEREYILYRAVGLDEAIKSCEVGHLVYYSRDPMSRDWEVIEYGLGSEASEMSEEEIDEYVNDLVSWKRKSKGVNLTSDLDNAKGYSDIVLEINLVGYDYAEFSDVHIFAKNPDDCKIKSVYYNGKEYTKEEFLKIGVNKITEDYVSRDYYDQEYEEEYPKWKKTIIKVLESEIDSYAEINDGKIIILLNKENLDKNLIKYDKINQRLWYDYSLKGNLEDYIPYAYLSRHFNYAVQDYFKKHFPDYGVREIAAANIS